MSASGDAPDTRPFVYLREALIDGRLWEMRSFRSERFVDGTILGPGDDTELLADAYETWNTRVIEGHLVIWINPARAPRAPDLWYCTIPDPNDDRPALHLVAFATDDVAPGTVIDDIEFFALPVPSDQQAAAVRWWRDNGELDQVYVARDYRRLHVAAKLLRAASAFHMANGYPGVLHDTGRRTDLGESLMASFPPSRVAERRERMPPMDPPEP